MVHVLYCRFRGALSFNPPLLDWDTAALKRMDGMFYGASLFNADIGNWTTGAVQGVWRDYRIILRVCVNILTIIAPIKT